MKTENWLKHDLDTLQDLKIEALIDEMGHHCYGAWWRLIEILAAKGGEIDVDKTLFITLGKFMTNQLEGREHMGQRFVNECLLLGLLIPTELNGTQRICSPRLKRENEVREARHQQRVEGARIAGLASAKSRGYQRPVNAPSTESNGLNQIRSDQSKIRSIITPPTPSSAKSKIKTARYRDFVETDFQWPQGWGVNAKKAVKDWIEYKAQAGHASILKSYQAQINKFGSRPRDYFAFVNRAIEKGWQGLNEETPIGQTGRPQNQPITPQPRPVYRPFEDTPTERQERPSAESLEKVKSLIASAFPKAYKEGDPH